MVFCCNLFNFFLETQEVQNRFMKVASSNVFLPGLLYLCYLKALPALESSDQNRIFVGVGRVEKWSENYFWDVIILWTTDLDFNIQWLF